MQGSREYTRRADAVLPRQNQDMPAMLSETCEARKEAGTSEARARAAAEEIAAFESRLIRMETKLNMVLSGTVALNRGHDHIGDSLLHELSIATRCATMGR